MSSNYQKPFIHCEYPFVSIVRFTVYNADVSAKTIVVHEGGLRNPGGGSVSLLNLFLEIDAMSNEGVIAVERALSLLDCFGPDRISLSLAEFAAAVPLHKTTIYRLLNSLERMNYVVKGADGRYSLGPRALYIGTVYATSFSLEKIVRPVLHALSEETRESASFYIEAQGGRLCLYRVEPLVGLRDHILAGTVFPADQSATGLVFERKEALEFGTCDDVLPYATVGVRDAYTSSFSIPVFGAEDKFVGALTLSGPTARISVADKEVLAASLIMSADKIARALGASRGKRETAYRISTR